MSSAQNHLTPQSAFPKLEIVNGVHSGVQMELDDDEYLVGMDASSDIVLRDNGVSPRHAKLRLEGRDARIEALGGDVEVGGRQVANGHGCCVRMPVTITIGDAVLRLLPGQAPQSALARLTSAMNRLGDHPVKLAGGVIACAIAVVAASHAMQGQTIQTPIADTARLDQTSPEQRNVGQAGPGSSASANQAAADELTAKLKEAGISSITVSANDGRLLAEGRLSDQQAAAWSSIQRWFDSKYAQSTVLVPNVAIGPLTGPAPVRLQAVFFGQRPYIIADNGSRYYEGAVLESGWIIQRIEDDRMILGRDNETLALTYR